MSQNSIGVTPWERHDRAMSPRQADAGSMSARGSVHVSRPCYPLPLVDSGKNGRRVGIDDGLQYICENDGELDTREARKPTPIPKRVQILYGVN